VQDYKRLAALLPPDFHVLPSQVRADARAEGFGDGLLGRKPCSQKRTWRAMRKAVADLAWVQNALQEPVAKFLIRSLDTPNFDDVNADTQYHGWLVVALHEPKHFFHRVFHSNRDGPAHDAMADV